VGAVLSEWYYPDYWAPGATIEELSARNPVYFVNMDPEIVKQAFEKWDFPAMYMQAPPGSLGETQDRPITTIPVVATLAATRELDEDIAYELARVLYERAEQQAFVPYHSAGRGVTGEWVVSSYYDTPESRERAFHPGALRYYQERGIELLEFVR